MRSESGKGLEKRYYTKRTVRIVAVFCAVIEAVLFSLAQIFDFNPGNRMYAYRSKLLFVTECFLFFSALLITCLSAFYVKKAKPESTELPEEYEYKEYYRIDPFIIRIIRITTALVFFCEGIFRIILAVKGIADIHGSPITESIIFFTIFPLSLYFVPELSDKIIPGQNKTHLVLGSVGVLWFVFNAINDYFDYTVALSSPYRILTQLTIILSGLAIVYEIKMHTETPYPRARLLSLSLAAVSSSGLAAGRAAGILCGKVVSFDDTSLSVCIIMLAIYFIARLAVYSED